MGTLLKTPNAQWVLSASFRFNMSATGSPGGFPATADKATDTSGNLTAFSVAAPVYDILTLPPGAEVISGDVTVVTASNDTGTATISVGDSSLATRYLTTQSIKTAAATALVPTGFQYTGAEKIRITLANQNANATAGDVIVRVNFTLKDRANENLKTT